MTKFDKKMLIPGVATSFLAFVVYIEFWFDPYLGVSDSLDSLTNMQELTMETLVGKTNFLMSLATALFGLIGYIVVQLEKSAQTISFSNRLMLVISVGLIVLSIDFGYVYLQKWSEMLNLGAFKPFDPIVQLNQKLQFYTFLGGVAFTGVMLFNIKVSNT